MDFETYWKNLVDRVYRLNDILHGPDEVVYRLTSIYGETMVDGIEAYFERRFDEFDRDITVMLENGFTDIAADFGEARQIMFGNSMLTDSTIARVLNHFSNEDEGLEGKKRQIGVIYDRLIARLPELLERRDEIGVANGLFVLDAEQSL